MRNARQPDGQPNTVRHAISTEAQPAMKLMNTFGKAMAALAIAGLTIVPVASADPDRGRDRGGWDRGDRDHDRGRHGSGDRHDYRRGGHDYRGDYRRDHRRYDRHDRHDYRRDYRRPSYAYRYPPVRHYAPPPRYGSYVTYGYRTGPYFRSGYISPYRIGGYYRPHPRTVYIRDYSRYGLYAPPPGYYWVHDYDRGDAILASVATGAIIGLVVGALAYD